LPTLVDLQADFNVGLDKLHDVADKEAWEAQEAAARAARNSAHGAAALHGGLPAVTTLIGSYQVIGIKRT
jgi:hypothetical protein